MITEGWGKMHQEQGNVILLAMICLGVAIFSADLFLPLGFIIWILYLIPLLMSVWLPHRYAPFFTAWLISFYILLGSLASGAVHDTSDLSNRAVFILMAAIISLLVWEIRTNYYNPETEINKHRTAKERS